MYVIFNFSFLHFKNMNIRYFIILFFATKTHGSLTKVGNTFMKDPNTCCALNPNSPHTKCSMSHLYATNKLQLAYSPGFPNRFPIGRFCLWSVRCRSGYQIRLEFRDFYLIGPNNDKNCVDQYVTITSPITGHSMGPFCGNTGIPTIVAAGNLVIVDLQSHIPMSAENFRGFNFVFRETMEAPNPEMRPADWINHGQYSWSNRQIFQKLRQLRPTEASLSKPSPSPATRRTTQSVSSIKNLPELSTTLLPSAKPTVSTLPTTKRNKVFPTRFRYKTQTPPLFAIEKPKRRPGLKRRPNLYGDNNQNKIKIANKKKTDPLSLVLPIEVIVGIAVGGLCAIVISILIGCKINQAYFQKPSSSSEEKTSQEYNDNTSPSEFNESAMAANEKVVEYNYSPTSYTEINSHNNIGPFSGGSPQEAWNIPIASGSPNMTQCYPASTLNYTPLQPSNISSICQPSAQINQSFSQQMHLQPMNFNNNQLMPSTFSSTGYNSGSFPSSYSYPQYFAQPLQYGNIETQNTLHFASSDLNGKLSASKSRISSSNTNRPASKQHKSTRMRSKSQKNAPKRRRRSRKK